MIKLDHLVIFVSHYPVSRDWYQRCFGLRLKFENETAGFGGLEDDGGIGLILVQRELAPRERDCVLTFQCESVDEKHRELSAAGMRFTHPPSTVFWGYGAELPDPDGYAVRLWDRMTMPGYVEK